MLEVAMTALKKVLEIEQMQTNPVVASPQIQK